jgi:nucleotide-binding universal stress UspA family protein
MQGPYGPGATDPLRRSLKGVNGAQATASAAQQLWSQLAGLATKVDQLMLPRDSDDGNRVPESMYPVMVGVDGSFVAIRAARWAAAIAEEFDAPLQIVHAAVEGESAAAILQSAEQAVRAHLKGVDLTIDRVDGAADQVLIELSTAARLMVLGTHGPSPSSAFVVGSTTMTVAAYSTCPVVAWRGDAISPTQQPVVVGVDHDKDTRMAITAAFEFADRLGVRIIAVHAWSVRRSADDASLPSMIFWRQVENDARQHLSDTLMPWIDLYPNVEVVEVVDSDKPSRALLRSSKDAQLLVVGSRASGLGVGGRLGSIGIDLLHHSTIPIMFCHSVDGEG